MSARGKFTHYMVAIGAARHAKFRRMTPAEREAFFMGVLSLAAQAPIRGCLLVGDLPADEVDVAGEADVSVKDARSALEKLRRVGVLYMDEELGCERVHDFEDHNPPPKRDATAAARMQRYRDRMKENRIGRRYEVFDRDGNACRHCGSGERLEIDHVIPLNQGGADSIDNLQTLCRTCNASKQDRNEPAEKYRNAAEVTRNVTRGYGLAHEEVEEKRREDPPAPVTGGADVRVLRFDKKPVPPQRLDLAERLFAEFNRQAGTSYQPYTGDGKPSEGLRRIIGALTAHPSVAFDQAAAAIRWQLARPYWGDAAPKPGNVFGPNVFDGTLESSAGERAEPSTSDFVARMNSRRTSGTQNGDAA